MIRDRAPGVVGPWPSVRRLAMDACLGLTLDRELVLMGDRKMVFPIEIRYLSVMFPNLETLRIEAENKVSRSSGLPTVLQY